MAHHIWTITEARARLSEILRRARSEPQQIGTREPFVLVPKALWDKLAANEPSLGRWLVANAPRAREGDPELELPNRRERPRPNPFEASVPAAGPEDPTKDR